MTDQLLLLNCLGDGNFHSGEDLAVKFGVSRTAIWKQIKKLNAVLPFVIKSVASKGYQIEVPIQFLNRDMFVSSLAEHLELSNDNVEILLECASTNQFLIEHLEQGKQDNFIVLSEMQSNGRGRRGREWVSPIASNIYMSLLWSLGISIGETSGLSLVVAISIARALQKFKIENVKLKWPNDIYVNSRKISGVLLEMRGELNSPCHVIIGIGVNVNMPKNAANNIEQAWTDIHNVLGHTVNRNVLAAAIVDVLVPNLRRFSQHGFSAFIGQWNALDFLANQSITIDGHMNIKKGIARGVDRNGALRVEINNKVELLYSGEVSVRTQ